MGAFVALAVLAGMLIIAGLPKGSAAQEVRLVRQADGSMLLARPGVTAPLLDVFEDFDCPFCKQLHDTSEARLEQMVDEGRLRVVFHTVTIFAEEPSRSNSIRAAAAARCVPSMNWLAFRSQVYGMQPAPHGQASGYTVEELVAAGRRAGVTDSAFADCVTSQRHAEQHLEDNARIRIDGTPTLLLDGRPIRDLSALDEQATSV
ncbi:thioredoxin domain-containing protein [Nonomuraea sp. NPDC049152]|uniref:DsbA family protein n=1 Tax=Nonomuraea sp. NPDC049152 TaxID=3154350 RepID=UPI0033F329EF